MPLVDSRHVQRVAILYVLFRQDLTVHSHTSEAEYDQKMHILLVFPKLYFKQTQSYAISYASNWTFSVSKFRNARLRSNFKLLSPIGLSSKLGHVSNVCSSITCTLSHHYRRSQSYRFGAHVAPS
jgi:hypothetical protein